MIKETGLVDKLDISGFKDTSDLDKKKKAELKSEQDKTTKLQAFDSRYICGKNHFNDEDNGTPNYLLFQLVYKISKIVNIDHI